MKTQVQINEHSSSDSLINLRSGSVTKILFIMLIAVMSGISLYAQPAPPTSVTANPFAVCPTSPFSALRATSPGNSIKWYVEPTGGTSIGTSASGANFNITVTAPTTYYAESVTTSGISSTTRTSVDVSVNTAPEITSLPSDIMQNSSAGQCGAPVNYSAATASGIPAPVISYSQSSGSNYDVGSNTVIVAATNVCATTSLSFDITVADIENPGVIAPPSVTVTAPIGASSVTGVDLGTPVVSDNCGVSSVENNAPSVYYGGNTTVTWTVTDIHGNTATATQLVTIVISNMPPTINSITTNDPDNIVGQGSSITLTINWTDEAGGGPYSINIDWRDSSAHTIINGITSYSKSVAHTYSKTGVFAPVVIVTDGSNTSSTLVFKYLVVYVSGNYSTTADGTFTAPAGSLVSNPNLSANNRKVTFGNHCKPKSCHPGDFDGELELEMNGANFEFETEDVDWDYLAVSGCYLAEFKGTGFMYPNGHHGGCHGHCHNSCNYGYNPGYHYGVLIVQSDKSYNQSNKNKIRIKIWNMDLGNAVVFDTQMGAPDAALPTTSLTCGSIYVRIPNSCVPRLMSPDYDNEETTADNAISLESSIFPNPFQADFNVSFKSLSSEKVQIAVYDIAGKMVQEIPAVEPNTSIKVQSDLSPGAYFLHATQGDITKVVKVIKSVN